MAEKYRIRIAPFDAPEQAVESGIVDIFNMVVTVENIHDIRVSGIAPGYQYVIEEY